MKGDIVLPFDEVRYHGHLCRAGEDVGGSIDWTGARIAHCKLNNANLQLKLCNLQFAIWFAPPGPESATSPSRRGNGSVLHAVPS
jgi:hypothetical protein